MKNTLIKATLLFTSILSYGAFASDLNLVQLEKDVNKNLADQIIEMDDDFNEQIDLVQIEKDINKDLDAQMIEINNELNERIDREFRKDLNFKITINERISLTNDKNEDKAIIK